MPIWETVPVQSNMVKLYAKGLFAWRNYGGISMVWRNAGGICERKTLFRMKKEADQAGFKGTRTGP